MFIAINKSELTNKWFLSAFLTQWHPESNLPVQSLGTKVVSFKVQNGQLFVFDVADIHAGAHDVSVDRRRADRCAPQSVRLRRWRCRARSGTL